MSKILPSLVLLALIPSTAVAQITPDSSLGAEKSIVDSNGDRDTIKGGAIRDANLFHSFQEFNVGAGREAYFSNPNGIANIFSRVTGNNLSNILGTLGVLGDANLFFMNPNGIVFGANARLDVRGSFLGSTADSLAFENGFEFSASNPQAPPPLLTIDIPIGLNFRDNPGDIVNRSVALDLDNNNNTVGLQVQPGNTLALIGGEVNLDGGTLTAQGGRVELGGVSAAGTVGLNSDGSLSVPDDVARANVSIINDSIIDVRAGGEGSIMVNVRNLEVREGSQLLAGIREGLGTPEAQAGDIKINATDLVKFDGDGKNGNSSGAFSQVRQGAEGKAGDVSITTGSLEVTNGARLSVSTYGVGDAGTITIEATDRVVFDGESSPGFISAAFSQVNPGADGDAEGVFITTGSLEVTNGALLSASTFGVGNAGTVTIEATDRVVFDGVDSTEGPSGVFSLVEAFLEDGFVVRAVGNAGGIKIETTSLEVTNGAILSASTLGVGNAGTVTIEATDQVVFDGFSSATSQVAFIAEGNAGGVSITTGFLEVTNTSQLAVSTFGEGDAGSITINAKTFEASNRGRLISSTSSQFPAGDIILKVKDNITLSGSDAGIFANTTKNSTGKGGSIIIDPNINPRTLTIRDGAIISVDSQGTGIGGDITLSAGFLTLDKGTISAETRSNTGGNITLNLQDLLLPSNDSKISTTAGNQEFGGDGGNITINTPFIVAFPDENSDITANAFQGRGGEINITAQGIFGIEERKTSEENRTNDIDASSEFGLAGVVEINQPDVDPNRGLVELPETVVDPNTLIAQNPCKRGSESEFVITGRGGLPPSLSEDLSSEVTQVGLVEPALMEAGEQGSRGAGEQTSSSSSVPTTIIPAQGWIFNDKGEIVLVAYNPTVTGSQRLKESLIGCPTSGRN